ncbi:hypothetical protein P167DRAFT_605923 [Morchella conica CCBAS932]|uniref:Uncharacterized protein n=1 Tax=Morchella conica CCBAS932 TaxID=1392247 RepID=A0A3N4KRS2_9PEZI|nr:hypothetical protein P167DRAFT_605923 [Morchella conica CCBAS932]
MGISISALIPLILVCCLVIGGVIAFGKIITTPEPQQYSAYYMYSNNYETVPDRSMSVVTTPERVYVPPGDVERGLGMSGGGAMDTGVGGMGYAGGQESRMSGGRESRMSGGMESRMSGQGGMGYMPPGGGREMGGGMGYMPPSDGGREMEMGGEGAGQKQQMAQT